MKYIVFFTALVLPWMAFSEVKCGTCNGRGYCYNICHLCEGKGFVQYVSRFSRNKVISRKCHVCDDDTTPSARGKTRISCQDCLGTGKVGGGVRPGGVKVNGLKEKERKNQK